MTANAQKRQNARIVWPGRKSRCPSDRLGFQRVPKGTCGGFHAGISLACMQTTCASPSKSGRREASGCARRKPVGTSQGLASQAGWVSVVHQFGLAQVLGYIAINLHIKYTTRRSRHYHPSRSSISHSVLTGLEDNLGINQHRSAPNRGPGNREETWWRPCRPCREAGQGRENHCMA